MPKYAVEIVILVEAPDADTAWTLAQEYAYSAEIKHPILGVDYVSEPLEEDEE